MPETEKLASIVARRVEDRIIMMGWPVGQSLGSEAGLIEQYGVSRGVLREAVRLLEHKQVAAMRSGPNGGLIIGAPASSAIAETVSNYFNFSSVPTSDVFVARRSIESACLRIAAERMSERGIQRLRDAVNSNRGADLHRAMTSLTRNPALSIIVGSLLSASPVPQWDAPTTDETRARQRELVETFLSGDLASADRLLLDELDRQDAASENQLAGATMTALMHQKLPQQVAYRIYQDYLCDRHVVGEVIGSEQELIDRYEFCRTVFRQTARILEYYDIVHMRPGRTGGMAVGSGSAENVVDTVVTYLDFMQVDPLHLAESRRVLELGALTLAMERLDADGEARLVDELEAEAAMEKGVVYKIGPDFHLLLADLSGNVPIRFFAKVLARLQTSRIGAKQRTPEESDQIGSRISHAHERLVEAMLAGDVGLARHRLDRHLVAMTENVAPKRVINPAN